MTGNLIAYSLLALASTGLFVSDASACRWCRYRCRTYVRVVPCSLQPIVTIRQPTDTVRETTKETTDDPPLPDVSGRGKRISPEALRKLLQQRSE